jgi:undecaprenyl-diphosphatase
MTGLALLVTVWNALRRRWIVALGCALIPATGGLFDLFLKTSFDRARPDKEWRDAAVHETNESFPSGHSMGSMIGLGLLGYTLFLEVKNRRARWAIVIGLSLAILLIGLSRVYLRAHWASDVIGGIVIGLAWLALGVGIMERYRKPLQIEPEAPARTA